MNVERAERLSREFVVELRKARLAAGISVYRLSKNSGVSKSMIHNMEIGERNPTMITAFAIASALGGDFPEMARRAIERLGAD